MLKIPALLLALLPAALLADSSVWKISKGEQSLYIGGTCHVLRSTDYPLPAEFDQAYEAADTLVFEIDPAAAQDPAFAMQLLAKASYSDGRTLKSVLSADAYAALAKQGKQSGLPIELLNSLKPGMVMMMLTMQELTKAGVTEEGVDMHYHARGLKDGKSVDSLETPEFQIDLLTSMGEGIEDELVLYGLEDLSHMKELFNELIAAWRSGDLAQIEALFISDMVDYPELYSKLLVDRNRRWIPQIEAYMKTPEIEFVLVGAAHAASKDGILALLKNRGYTVEQL
ncbi:MULTISPECIES: TraB/GumN family protein [unclassified Lentimonas]|uniref:TraB/GumN family protein n=1 Tax=unclassified Lentimonas TaxID=2630993 RepID=UPI001323F157|nr:MULTISPECIES: TraB/GumN family protein [unclassified Lentimonas]CAA6676363.1 Unannotated [Lentimonas sp. CC4]CAA6685201.1 Unannotated [Lentimonas sp. CC6]CAA6693379.1 Unannotated [Lentimonas sp. CC19]CAA6696499.1 Unannotated [Lentimonas sp. CC10]CAA7072403.1 Unannotated [Lentimonas sp. CC11]